MKDIYELKAQKYKLKYEKLLQELAGGQLIREQEAEFQRYEPEPEADYERYRLTQQETRQPIISYQQFVELENQRRANDAMRRRIIRLSTLLQRQIDRGQRPIYSNYAKNFIAKTLLKSRNRT